MVRRTAFAVAFAALVAVAPLAGAPARAAASLPASDPAPADAVAVAPKVVIVVGATESTTATYRDMADSIYAEAIKWTPNVVKLYSPNATWALVKAAAQGASIFVYLGHGYGFPSKYTTELKPLSQDGMGLNTQLGLGDTDKKYYGEQSIADGIRFAPGAIVFLNHLCYAPGAAEPGMAEPTVAVAKQRVDNFASGFIRAGARAVVADDYTTSVQASIRAIFTSHQSIVAVWRSLWGYHGHEIPWTPTRNPAFQSIMDPETWTTGFKRAITYDTSFSTDDVLAGAGVQPTNLAPATLTVPGAAAVGSAGAPTFTDATLTTPTGSTLAAGTSLRVDDVVDGTPAGDGATPPPAVQVETLDGSATGWVSGDGLLPRDSSSPRLWSMTGDTTVSPNFDGTEDRLSLWARLSEPAAWTATLTDAAGTVLRTVSGSSDLPSFGWDALPGGSPAPAGTYHWHLQATDAWGNPALDTSGDVAVVDMPIPSTAVLALKSLQGSYTNLKALAFEVTFATDVSGLEAADFSRTGTATNCVVNAPTGAGADWMVTVSSCSAGTVQLGLKAGSVLDASLVAGPPVDVLGAWVRIDRSKPTAHAPKAAFRNWQVVAGAAMPMLVSWPAASDSGGSGLSTYDVARSVDGAAFKLLQGGLTATRLTTNAWSGHTYRFEVRARDRAGNVGGWVAGPTLRPVLVQQTSSAVSWSGSWTTDSGSAYMGGSARTASAAGASASYSFSGRAVALVVSRDPAYGQVKVYLDGAYVMTVDTASSGHADRAVVFSRTFAGGSHTLRLVAVGTAGRPTVVVDAFEVIR
jgi:hypothetical protein